MDALRKPVLLLMCALGVLLFSGHAAFAQEQPTSEVPHTFNLTDLPFKIQQNSQTSSSSSSNSNSSDVTLSPNNLPDLTQPKNVSAALQIIILLTVLSLAPAILIMMTSFTRIIIVLSLLRQALGTQQLPPNQVLIGLSLFMTFLIMAPTWNRVNEEALQPFMNGSIDHSEAMDRAAVPLRDFMIKQIYKAGNVSDVALFDQYAGRQMKPGEEVKWKNIGTMTIVPAFMLSELKTAFFMGFKVYLPFLIIDMVISAVLISMGMMMLPPVLISLPFKLLLFVLVDGWHLITSSLMGSFVT
jgi:flagellar biosynthetic protein FliP